MRAFHMYSLILNFAIRFFADCYPYSYDCRTIL